MPPIAELRQSHLLDDSIVEDHLGDARRHGNGAASLVRSDDKIQWFQVAKRRDRLLKRSAASVRAKDDEIPHPISPISRGW